MKALENQQQLQTKALKSKIILNCVQLCANRCNCDFSHFNLVTELMKLYLPRRDPRVAPSCLQERPNVTGIKQVSTQS